MNLKKPVLTIVILILLNSIFAGCINLNDVDDKDSVEGDIVTVSEVLGLNETKSILVGDTTYNFTVEKIDGENVTVLINSDELKYYMKPGDTIDVDVDLDGTNDFEMNIVNNNENQITLELKSTSTTSKYKYIKDDTGVTVKIPKDFNKIVSLAPSITEILFELELGDKIIGRDSGSNYPAEALDIDVVSTFEGVDMELILVKQPDIVFIDKTIDIYGTNYDRIRDFGFCVFRIYPQSLQDVLDDIELLGKVTDTETKAEEVVSGLETRINVVETRESSEPKVLHVFYYDGASSPWVATTSTFSGDLIRLAGGKIAVEDNSGASIQITVEDVIDLNPDIIFTSQDETWPTPSRDAILKDEVLKDVAAVKNDKVIDVNADLVDRPGPRLVDGLELFSSHMS